MNTLFLIIWLVLTIAGSLNLIHILGKEYGEHVALDTNTRVAVFMGVGTFVALGLGLIKWLVS